MEPPIYEYGRVKIGRSIFNMPIEDTELFSNPKAMDEQMALLVLRRWQEVPRVGTKLVPEHVETRPLYNPGKPGMKGRFEILVFYYNFCLSFSLFMLVSVILKSSVSISFLFFIIIHLLNINYVINH